ncbi:hypothetical protein MKW92_013808 [Papaver armeniacum]|nr:hypothetical protein MKW92_013808 [Papaver armeniacum]
MQGGPNYILLQHLNIDGICTIGSVLGQSVALDYYCCLVDQLVNEYSGVNFRLEASGACKKGIKQSILLCEMDAIAIAIYRFGLSERSDIAWEDDTKYSQMLDYLLDNFNLVERFEGLDRKFKIGELNNDFVVERMKLLIADILGFVFFICMALVSFSPLGLLYRTMERLSHLNKQETGL